MSGAVKLWLVSVIGLIATDPFSDWAWDKISIEVWSGAFFVIVAQAVILAGACIRRGAKP